MHFTAIFTGGVLNFWGHLHYILCTDIACTPTHSTGRNRSNHQRTWHCFASSNNGGWIGTSMQRHLLWRSQAANVGKEIRWEQREGMHSSLIVCTSRGNFSSVLEKLNLFPSNLHVAPRCNAV